RRGAVIVQTAVVVIDERRLIAVAQAELLRPRLGRGPCGVAALQLVAVASDVVVLGNETGTLRAAPLRGGAGGHVVLAHQRHRPGIGSAGGGAGPVGARLVPDRERGAWRPACAGDGADAAQAVIGARQRD